MVAAQTINSMRLPWLAGLRQQVLQPQPWRVVHMRVWMRLADNRGAPASRMPSQHSQGLALPGSARQRMPIKTDTSQHSAPSSRMLLPALARSEAMAAEPAIARPTCTREAGRQAGCPASLKGRTHVHDCRATLECWWGPTQLCRALQEPRQATLPAQPAPH